jgi:hypothetical protein
MVRQRLADGAARKAWAFGRRSPNLRDEDGGREGKV